jgi:cytochrome c peroxidase
MESIWKSALCLFVIVCAAVAIVAGTAVIPNLQPYRDPTGYVATYNKAGDIDKSNPFFQSLGTNGRSCETCHQADQAFSMSVVKIRQRFVSTQGTDPLFAPVDGANCPTDKQGDAASHSLLLNNGLIRVGITMPANPEFALTVVHDPYGCAITTDPETGHRIVSVYRRPLPSTNLGFLSTVMFDGRETIAPLNDEKTFTANLITDLTHQAMDAVLTHAQASQPPTQVQLGEIVKMERGFYTAQLFDDQAGSLYINGANGGPKFLSKQLYYPGINDSLGGDPHGKRFDPTAMTIYAEWQTNTASGDGYENSRNMIAAGEQIFNTTTVHITGVRGLNDNPALNYPTEIDGTCTTCHDAFNVGDHSLPLPLDIGTSHALAFEPDPRIAGGLTQLSAPDLPVYLVTGCTDPVDPSRHLTFYTSDPGKGLISGKCSDVNRGKGPILRGIAARAPYFHNGAAANLEELVNFYDNRFQMNLTDEQKKQLIAFLNSL